MAKVVQKSKLASKIGQALKAHAQDETDYGMDFTNLPPGIVGGIARLVEAKIGVYKKGANEGEKFLYLAGAVVEPDEVNVIRKIWQDGKVVNMPLEVVKIKGLRTSQMMALCDTRNAKGEVTSADDNVAEALNMLRVIGGEEFTAGLAESQDPETELDSLLEALKEAGPYIRFNTRGGTPTAQYPNERTWEDWRGAIADYVPSDNEGAIVDETVEMMAADPSLKPAKGKAKPATEPEEEGDEPPDEPGVATSAEGEEDLDDLAESADRNDAEDEDCVNAQNRLTELATEKGIDGDAKDKKGKPIYPTWTSLAEALKSDGEEEEEATEEEEAPWKPAKEEVYNCKLPHAKKATEIEITLVDEKKRLVNVKRLDNGNVVKGLSWDLLER